MKRKSKRRRRKNKILWVLMICMGISAITLCATKFIGIRKDRTTPEEVYSDNIYFAKAALKIGAEEMKDFLLRLGFQEELPFEIVMAKSQFSNTENIETEIQLADSGYGQGQILINSLHMACIYTAFFNEGNVIKLHLLYSQETKPEYWIPNAFSADHTNIVLEGLKKQRKIRF